MDPCFPPFLSGEEGKSLMQFKMEEKKSGALLYDVRSKSTNVLHWGAHTQRHEDS